MNFIYSGWYGVLLKITDIILLGLLWAIVSIPLITIYPATIALFETMKKWDEVGTTGQVWSNFFMSFRSNITKKIICSLFGIIIFGSIYINFYLYSSVQNKMDATIAFLTFISNSISMLIFYVSCTLWKDDVKKFRIKDWLVTTISVIILHPSRSFLLVVLLIIISEVVIIFPILYVIVGIILGLISRVIKFS